MSSFRLTPASILESCPAAQKGRAGAAGVTISERTGVSLCSVVAGKAQGARLGERVKAGFGLELPQTPRINGQGDVAFLWAGPHQWLALSEEGNHKALEQQLKLAIGDAASITDQSDGRVIFRISGPRVRDALAKGILIDLHPRAFKPGDTAVTSIAYINLQFWQVDAAPTYDIAMFRSFAAAFVDWFVEAGAEFGAGIDPS